MDSNVLKVLRILERFVKKFDKPVVEKVGDRDAFKILVSTVLSARTKDSITELASRKLFSKISTPFDLINLDVEEIERLIYPVGFYHTKAKNLKKLAKVLVEKFEGKVPSSFDQLVSLPGVGRKTANLVLSLAFGKDAICVDTHVHRISNRLGWVKTKTPEQTEEELKKLLPKSYWKKINHILVLFGQNICLSTAPKCGQCPIAKYCPKVGVKKYS